MNLLILWIPTFAIGVILIIAALVLRIYNLRIERREREGQLDP